MPSLLKNTIENVMGLMVIMGIVLVLMETIMVSTGMWWILLVGCLILLGKCPKHTTKRNFAMVHNGILMETIGISVMVFLLGFYCFFSRDIMREMFIVLTCYSACSDMCRIVFMAPFEELIFYSWHKTQWRFQWLIYSQVRCLTLL